MERFTQAIKKSIESENWYAALTLALTLPDICGRISYPDLKEQSKKRYIKWFDDYMLHRYRDLLPGDGFIFMSGGDCYALRCALLHEGRDDIAEQKAKRKEVLSKFVIATTGAHKGKINSVLILGLQSFCNDVCEGVEKWNEDYKDDSHVQEGIKELLTIQTGDFYAIPGVFIEK